MAGWIGLLTPGLGKCSYELLIDYSMSKFICKCWIIHIFSIALFHLIYNYLFAHLQGIIETTQYDYGMP